MKRILGLLSPALLVTALVATPTPTASADPSGEGVPDGAVQVSIASSLVAHDGKIVAGRRAFTTGRVSGSGIVVNADGSWSSPAPFDREVGASTSDGAGGWYVAGLFTSVGGQVHKRLVHLRADGTPDPAFDVTLGVVYTGWGSVRSLELVGDTLYLAGGFAQVNGEPRGEVAAVDATTGEVLPFAPDGLRRSRINALAVVPPGDDGPGRVFVATSYKGLKAFDPATGAKAPGFTSSPYDAAYSLALDGDDLYVGGDGVQKLDVTTGAADPAFDQVHDGPYVTALALDGDRLYAGGDFSQLRGRPGPLVALDPTTGAADPAFAPDIDRRFHPVSAIAVLGDDLWLGAGGPLEGSYLSAPRLLVRLDAETGAALTAPAIPYSTVDTVSASGDRLFVGGNFAAVDPVRLQGLASFAPDTLDLISTGNSHYRQDGDLLDTRTALYVAPTHLRAHLAHPTRSTILALDPTSGALTGPGKLVVTGLAGLATTSGTTVAVTTVPGETDPERVRSVVTVRSAATGDVLRHFRVPARGLVQQVVVHRADLYLAGHFHPAGQRRAVGAIRLSTTGRLNGAFRAPSAAATDLSIGAGHVFVTVADARTATTSDGRILSLDADTGRRSRRFSTPADRMVPGYARTTVVDGKLFVAGRRGARFVDLATGHPLPGAADGHASQVAAVLPWGSGFYYLGDGEVDFLAYAEN